MASWWEVEAEAPRQSSGVDLLLGPSHPFRDDLTGLGQLADHLIIEAWHAGLRCRPAEAVTGRP